MAKQVEWEAELEKSRKDKDKFFGSDHPHSPIPLKERPNFKGLNYYPPNPAYRFKLELHKHKDKAVIKVEATKGEKREFIRWGEFRFKIHDKASTLQAYKNSPGEPRLFIPFRDATIGKETYGAGRYIDLDPEKNRTDEGKWLLDFNVAYNPWCAYSEEYTCPLVPPENWLKVPIRGGEKDFHHKKSKKV